MSDNIKEFESFSEPFKLYQDGVSYDDMVERKVFFDSEAELTPISMLDPEQIIQQSADISKRQFYFTNIYESQKRVLQTIEDEFTMWYAGVYCEMDNETETLIDKKGKEIIQRVKRTKEEKDMLLKTRYVKEFTKYYSTVKQEKFKLGMVQGIVQSLKSFSFKLNNINEYAKNIEV